MWNLIKKGMPMKVVRVFKFIFHSWEAFYYLSIASNKTCRTTSLKFIDSNHKLMKSSIFKMVWYKTIFGFPLTQWKLVWQFRIVLTCKQVLFSRHCKVFYYNLNDQSINCCQFFFKIEFFQSKKVVELNIGTLSLNIR